jgi:hypothetical protein
LLLGNAMNLDRRFILCLRLLIGITVYITARLPTGCLAQEILILVLIFQWQRKKCEEKRVVW